MNRKLKPILAGLLAAAMLCCPALAVAFPDIDESANYAEAVDYISDIGIMVGDTEGHMEKTELTVSIEPERLDVLNYFLSQENTTAQKELERMLAELYEKKVPEQMRGYIDSRRRGASGKRPPRPASKPAGAAPVRPDAKKEEHHEQ